MTLPTRVQESDFYLGDKALYTSVYDAGASRWLVIVPPLFEELPRTRKLLANVARKLARAGFNVVRFDYHGTGLSEGRWEDFTPSQAMRDLESAVSFCRDRGAQQVALLGFRYGAYLAAQFARRDDVQRVIVWEPILDPAGYFAEFLKSTAVDQIMTCGEVKFSPGDLMEMLGRDGRILINGYALTAAAVAEFRQAHALDRGECEKLAVVLWRQSSLRRTPFLAELKPVMCANVKVAWDHIKFLDHEATEAVDATLGFLGCH